VFYFGPSGMACELLDGVFLAARKSTLLSKELRFDQRFRFHFYDLDFCRSARQKGLALGTAAIALTHQSYGGFTSAGWHQGLAQYLQKWGS
jgi:GT2 family glycosyltransferase